MVPVNLVGLSSVMFLCSRVAGGFVNKNAWMEMILP